MSTKQDNMTFHDFIHPSDDIAAATGMAIDAAITADKSGHLRY